MQVSEINKLCDKTCGLGLRMFAGHFRCFLKTAGKIIKLDSANVKTKQTCFVIGVVK